MLLFKRLLTSCILFVLLSLAVLISMGVVVGTPGGIHSPAVSDYDSSYAAAQAAVHENTRKYGPVVFLSTLSVSALAALAISFSGILPWCRKQSPSPPEQK
jgi:hypothetical protein